MATVKVPFDPDAKPTKEQIKELEEAEKMPIVYDEDSPELTPEQLAELAEAARQWRSGQKRQTVTLRVSKETLEKAKAVGPGYTGFLGRLLDNAINDPELVKRSL